MPPPASKLDAGLPLVLCGFASVYFLRSRQSTLGIYVPMVYRYWPLVKNECAVQLPNMAVKRDALLGDNYSDIGGLKKNSKLP